MVGVQIRADAGIDTGGAGESRLDLRALAMQAVHIGGRAAEIGDHPGETRHLVAYGFYLADHRVLGAALDDAAFVLRDRAKRAAAEAAALNRTRHPNNVGGGHLAIAA